MSKSPSENLWIDGRRDDLSDPLSTPRRPRTVTDATRHIGCPMRWFRLVFPIVRGKNELAVALYIYRLHTIRRSRTIKVYNSRLLAELGIDRFAKYRALRRLAEAGIITVKRRDSDSLEVTFKRKRDT
jgi:hypothetical protein